MKRFNILLFAIVLLSCSQNKSPLIAPGPGQFIFQNDNLINGKPIMVYTYRPTKYSVQSPILFVMHGNGRTAKKYRDVWIPIAEENNALLLVPEFSRDNFPLDQDYNMGHMFKMDSLDNLLGENPENIWSYSLIDPIFNYVVKKMKNRSTSYLIYGHSAGSQFVHRFLFFRPNSKAGKAVCANAGWYTMPDFSIQFPYGLKETRCTIEDLKKAFARPVTILLGDQDVDPHHKSLRHTPQAMKQGSQRFARGHIFFQACKHMADSLNTPFHWKQKIVPGVAHSNSGMAPAAARVLFAKE